MDDDYMNEVLPRWQFWKEYLIAKLENYKEAFEGEYGHWALSDEQIEKIEKMNAEMIEKVKEIKSRTDLKKIRKKIIKWMRNLNDCCDWRDPEPTGLYWDNIDNEDKLSNWLALADFCGMMNQKNEQTEKTITK